MHPVTEQLGQLKPGHVQEALRRLEAGEATDFSESTKYDLVHNGTRYPPKRVAGLALEVLTGLRFGPKSFKGGEESSCFRALRRCGFTVSPKGEDPNRPLVEDFREVLLLQRAYQSNATAEMNRRGELIRNIIPNHLRAGVNRLEPIFSAAGYSLEIEGSDGIGRKVESPWVRIYDGLMSDSATRGWYVVLHFSRDEDRMFSTVGCGAATFRDGSLVDIPAAELSAKVRWARGVATKAGFPPSAFNDPIELHGNSLSRQFERATAFAKRYDLSTFSEAEFWADLQTLCGLLVQLYDQDRLGKAPFSDQPEVVAGETESLPSVSSRRARAGGQGRGLTPTERLAVEERSMDVAREVLKVQGFTQIDDVHLTHPYDFEASYQGVRWPIEVKGTTSPSMENFFLTANEFQLHQGKTGGTALVLVCNIELQRSSRGVTGSGGDWEIFVPWSMDGWEFVPTVYRARRTKGVNG